MDISSAKFSETSMYPPIVVNCPDRRYAEAMLGNIGAANSEMSAVSLYFYNSVIMGGDNSADAAIFHKISIVEMHHLEIFAKLAFALGADPRLWSYARHRPAYWSPGFNKYPTSRRAIIENAILGENEAIAKYRDQAAWIDDINITAILERVILDELLHIKIFREMLNDA